MTRLFSWGVVIFDSIKSSGAVVPVFIVFYGFLGVPISELRTHELCSRVHPFHLTK